ncbi:MAG TPA: transposase [Longimicrobiaceae bacterium]
MARKALEVARRAIPAYSSKYSKHDFTQHQMLAILALAQFLKTDDRGIVAYLEDWSDLREALGLARDKLPHPTTVLRARQRLAKRGALRACSARSSEMLANRG